MRICLTGKMAQNRMSESDKFESYGIHVTKKVSGLTDYLVTGTRPAQSKLNAARMNNTTIMTESEFFDMLVEVMPEFLL